MDESLDDQHWWQTATIYQVYPRSYKDTNGDGVGDLRGLKLRLPYLKDFGIDAVWISPIFRSPMKDFGYDISDYCAIDPLFGTMADFDDFLKTAHRLGLKVLLDLVPNHSSDQHPWFLESRKSRRSPKRNWYIWRDPAPDGGPPNNWLSEFGGSAWQYDDASGQYYYHAFLASQPDLNWRNPDVRNAMFEVMRFWLRKGVDGFRVDVIWHLMKDSLFRDNPPNPDYQPGKPPHQKVVPLYSTDVPEVHEVIRDMRAVVDEFEDRLLIGEIYLPLKKLVAYYGRNRDGVHLPFNFALLEAAWNANTIGRLVSDYENSLPEGGWPNWVLGNHDRQRVATRVGHDQAPVAATLLLTLRGTPTVYYGDEIGLPQVAIPPERIQDPFEKNVPGIGIGRDGARTPMQWDTSANAGFSSATPWLPLASDWRSNNVQNLRADRTSIFNLYRNLIAMRRQHPALSIGSYRPVTASGDLMLYVREHDGERIFVALNFGESATDVEFASGRMHGTILLSSYGDRAGEGVEEIGLRSNEAVVIRLTDNATI